MKVYLVTFSQEGGYADNGVHSIHESFEDALKEVNARLPYGPEFIEMWDSSDKTEPDETWYAKDPEQGEANGFSAWPIATNP